MSMEYKTFCAEEVSNLDRKVTEALSEGWVLHGNVYTDGCRKCQPMVRYPPVESLPWDFAPPYEQKVL